MKIKVGEYAWCIADKRYSVSYYLRTYDGRGWEWWDDCSSNGCRYVKTQVLDSDLIRELKCV